MNYEKMWKDLKNKIIDDMAFHESGAFQSIDESVNCKIKCKQILEYMVELEGKLSKTDFLVECCDVCDVSGYVGRACPEYKTVRCPHRHRLEGYKEEK